MASAIVPGWAQLMYASPWSAVFFLVMAIFCWVKYGFPYALWVHGFSALHAATLVADHFSGKRPADETGIRSRARRHREP